MATSQDPHLEYLEDIEYRREYGAEGAKLETAATLVKAREAAGVTQQQLATMAGVSQAYIAKLERGAANPTIAHLARILACMNLKWSYELEPLNGEMASMASQEVTTDLLPALEATEVSSSSSDRVN